MILIRTTLYEERPPEASIRAWRNINREAHADMGEYWHTHFLPRHFEMGANVRVKYKHKIRSNKYLKRKRAMGQAGRKLKDGSAVQKGGVVDNVYSGLLEQSMKSSATIRAFPSRVTVNMHGPRYITMRPYKSNQPDKAAEITYVTQDENAKLTEILDKSTTDGLNKLRKPKTTRS